MRALSGAVGIVLLALAVAVMAATGALGAACLGARSVTGFLVAAYVIAWTQLVAVVLVLSPPALVTRGWVIAGVIVSAAAVVLVWHARGRPRPPSARPALRVVRAELRDPLVAALAIVVGVGGLYVLGLAFLTPALEWDPLAYHLARASFWEQQQSVSYVPNASDPRLDGNPPGAEIGVLATMLFSGGDRFAALPQVLAVGTLVITVAGIARRLGSSHRQAILAALVFAGLPLIALQAPTPYNDLVVASFLVVCGYAILGRTWSDLVLVALSLGMALTTKFTAVIALPLLGLLALVGAPPRRYAALAGAVVVGLLVGAPWYLVNLVETGHADGGLADETSQSQDLSLLAVAPTIRRYLFAFIDFSGSRDIGVFTLYGVVALVVLAVGLVAGAARGRIRSTTLIAVGAAAVIVLPLALVEVARGALRAWFKFWLVLGREDIARADASWELQVGSDAALSWYGPVAAALLVIGTVYALVDVIRRRRPPVVAVLACAPFVFVLVFALLVPWDPWRGRFMITSVAFAAAAWGPVIERRAVGWGVTAITVVVLPLSLLSMYTKPSGVPFVYLHDGRSIWTDRWDVVLDALPGVEGVRPSTAIERGEPGVVAVAARENDLLYLFFGHGQRNRVKLVPIDGGMVPADARWLVVPPGTRVIRCGRWSLVTQVEGWSAWRHEGGARPCVTVYSPPLT